MERLTTFVETISVGVVIGRVTGPTCFQHTLVIFSDGLTLRM